MTVADSETQRDSTVTRADNMTSWHNLEVMRCCDTVEKLGVFMALPRKILVLFRKSSG